MQVKIIHRFTGETILEVEAESVKTALEAAVAIKVSLDGARLDGARLDGARLDGASLVGASLVGASLDGASLDGASLDGARLFGASLDGASLDGASLDGASLDGASAMAIIDAGVERRGFRFWAWRHPENWVIYRGGCHEWNDFTNACAHYGNNYSSDGDREECLARLRFLNDEAKRRGWIE